MRLMLLGFAIATFIQARPSAPVRQLRTPCVPTAPMPMAMIDTTEAHLRYRMPIVRPDTSRLERMPVVVLRPCYWGDSTTQRPVP